MTKDNVVKHADFMKKREELDVHAIMHALKLEGNDFRGHMNIETDFDRYRVKLIFNFNEQVIVINEEFSIVQGIDLEVLTARVAEEIAIHVVVNTLRDAMREDDSIRYWLRRDQMR